MSSNFEAVEEWIVSPLNNQRIFTKTWTPTVPIATVIFLHGIGEHVQRYNEMFTIFAQNGIKVGGADGRGFGATGGDVGRGDWQGEEAQMADVKLVSDKIRLPNVPHFIMGQSMYFGR